MTFPGWPLTKSPVVCKDMASASITPVNSRVYGRSRSIPRMRMRMLSIVLYCPIVSLLLMVYLSYIYEPTKYKDMSPLSARSFSYECHCRMEDGDKDRAELLKSLIMEDAPSGVLAGKETHDSHPNLELNLLLAREKTRHCNLLPSLLELAWRDIYWQAYPASGKPKYLFYAAYLDDRPGTESKGIVRLLALGSKYGRVAFFCQFWRDQVQPPVWARVESQKRVAFLGGGSALWVAYVISCHLPDQLTIDSEMIPAAVSISATPCGRPSVLLKIVGAEERKSETLNRVNQEIWASKASGDLVNRDSPFGASVPEAQERYENLNNDSIFRIMKAGMKPLGAAEIVEEEEKADVVHGASAAMTRPSWERKDDWRVGVCGPALYYYNKDFSLRLVEWAEVMKHLGVSKVFLYEYDGGLHPNISKVLRHYENEGFFSLRKFSYPAPYFAYPPLKGIFTNHERQKKFGMEHIYFTDCILRNMRDFRFLAHFDPDEIPILPNHNTLSELIKYLYVNKTKEVRGVLENMPSSYRLEWRYFYDHFPAEEGAPSYMHALRMPWRMGDILEDRYNGKCIYDTRQIISVVSHNPKSCLSGLCQPNHEVPQKIAFAGHFRECREMCYSTLYLGKRDETLIKKRNLILPGMIKVLRKLGLLRS